MITAEIKINGALIGVVYAHNMGYAHGSNMVCTYDWEVTQIGQHRDPKTGKLDHNRSHGWEVLISKILEASKESNA